MSSPLDWTAIDTVILDMDGTLLDLHFDALVWDELLPARYAVQHGMALAVAREQIARTLGAVRGTLPWYCLDYWQDRLGIDVSALENELARHIGPRPGARDFLAWLRERKLSRVLATNAHPRSLARKLALTGIDVYFNTIISAHVLGYAKESDSFWPALQQRLGFDPDRTLLIDDNHTVLESAARHGLRYLYGIALPNSRGARLDSERFHCLASFAELMNGAEIPVPVPTQANASS